MNKLIILSLAMLVSLSTFAQDLLSKIPKDAVFVSVLKGKEVLKHVSEKELLNYQFANAFLGEFENAKTFEDLGVDLNQNFYSFITTTDSISYTSFLLPIKSADKIPGLFKASDKIETFGAFKGISGRHEFILWDDSSILFAFPFGVTKEIPSYGMRERVRDGAVEELAVETEETSSYESFDEYDALEEKVVAFEDEENLAAGKSIFLLNCTACHKEDGGGLIGPNHTDDYWLHGGSPKQIFHTIANGVPSKGMISWKHSLSPLQVQQVMSYVRSLRGTTPKNPKAPQGEYYDRSVESDELIATEDEEETVWLDDDTIEEKTPEKVKAPKNPTEELLKAFAMKIMSNHNATNSLAGNLKFRGVMNNKAVVTAWTNNYGEIYQKVLGVNNMPYYGYPRGMMGNMMNIMQRINSENVSGMKSITANLFLDDDHAELEVLSEMTDEMAGYYRKMSKQKYNKDFFRYFNGDKVMGYWGTAINVENAVDVYPKMVGSMLRKVMPDHADEAELGAEFVSILLDAEEIGELLNGDMMFVVSDVVEKEVKYTTYEYDDDFNATKVEKTKMESIPEFLLMVSTDRLDFFRKFMRLGAKQKLISQLQNNFYKIEADGSDLPMELYVVLKDDIFFLASSEYQARDIANGKKNRISRKHRRKTKNKSIVFYANNDKIINAIPTDFLSPGDALSLDYFHANFKDLEISSSKIKGNVVKSKMKINTKGGDVNSLQSFFGMLDQLLIN